MGETWEGRRRDREKRHMCKHLFTDTWATRVCDTHEDVWTTQWARCAQKKVRATGECVYASVNVQGCVLYTRTPVNTHTHTHHYHILRHTHHTCAHTTPPTHTHTNPARTSHHTTTRNKPSRRQHTQPQIRGHDKYTKTYKKTTQPTMKEHTHTRVTKQSHTNQHTTLSRLQSVEKHMLNNQQFDTCGHKKR